MVRSFWGVVGIEKSGKSPPNPPILGGTRGSNHSKLMLLKNPALLPSPRIGRGAGGEGENGKSPPSPPILGGTRGSNHPKLTLSKIPTLLPSPRIGRGAGGEGERVSSSPRPELGEGLGVRARNNADQFKFSLQYIPQFGDRPLIQTHSAHRRNRLAILLEIRSNSGVFPNWENIARRAVSKSNKISRFPGSRTQLLLAP